ncbi:MAG: 50S ribosomal protein L18 [Candidatus Paceibacterota bacterium]
MKTKNAKTEKRLKRHRKIRAKVSGTATLPRLSVFRSNKCIYAQLIDDEKASTILSASSSKLKGKMVEKAKAVGTEIAKKAVAKKIEKVVFDRGGYIYTGKIRALAEGAREGGLQF